MMTCFKIKAAWIIYKVINFLFLQKTHVKQLEEGH
jgi:hypothetical protein